MRFEGSVAAVGSAGGVGFDISCGVRLLVTPLDRDDLAPDLAAERTVTADVLSDYISRYAW